MAFLLGRGSAIEWLRMCESPASYTRYAVPYAGLEASRTRIKRHAQALEGLTMPYQLIVWTRGDRRRTAITQSHVLTTQDGKYPAFRVRRGLFVSTPEFVFVQMGTLLDAEQLLFLGCELCGRYGIDDGVFLREQTCTAHMLYECAAALKGVRGRRNALNVAPRVLGGGASPMEIALALMLHLPRTQGGYGLEAPELNHVLPVDGTARALWGKDHITPDMLWNRGHVVIEYDSDLHHSADERIANDARRRDVFVELGYRVVTVTTAHMRSFHEIERIAGIVAGCLGTSIETGDQSELDARASLQARMRRLAAHPEDLTALESVERKMSASADF